LTQETRLVGEMAARICIHVLGLWHETVALQIDGKANGVRSAEDLIRQLASSPKPLGCRIAMEDATPSLLLETRPSAGMIAAKADEMANFSRTDGLLSLLRTDFTASEIQIIRGDRVLSANLEALNRFFADYILQRRVSWTIRMLPPPGAPQIEIHVGQPQRLWSTPI
jgi:hypothetical protein